MPKFAVLLHGRSVLLLDSKGKPSPGGVYSWKAVEADQISGAIDRARRKLCADELYLKEVWNQDGNPPVIEAEEITELEEAADLEECESACVFYYDDENALPYSG